MTEFLVHRFIKNETDYKNEKVRGAYGTLSSVVGIICNVILFLLKYAMGTLANSISIVSDGFNNLSDAASCIVTLIGYRVAGKPADKGHPFGHGRMEYLISLVISAVILVVGVNLFTSSLDKVIHPKQLVFDWVVLLSLIFSILLKLWMSRFNHSLGKKIDSSAMLATSKDSANDVIATFATVIALVASAFTSLPMDGIMGIVVSGFVLWSGFGIIKETVDLLLGQPADPELVKKLKKKILSYDGILGVHDFILHNYGPGNMIGSVHVEVPGNGNIFEIHDLIDRIERTIHEEEGIVMTIHMDPVVLDDAFVNECRDMIGRILREMDAKLSLHDFRVVTGPTHTNLIFDIVVPYDCKLKEKEIEEKIQTELDKKEGTWYLVLTFDRDFVA